MKLLFTTRAILLKAEMLYMYVHTYGIRYTQEQNTQQGRMGCFPGFLQEAVDSRKFVQHAGVVCRPDFLAGG